MLSYQWSVNGQVAGIGATLSYAFPDNGTYSVSVVVSDLYGGTSTTSANVTISNANPTAMFNAPSTVNETSPITLSVSNVSDPSTVDVNAGLKIEFDCGAGAGYTAPGTATSVSCPTTEDGIRTVHARITDKDGGATILTASIAILNVAPTVTFKAVTPTTIQSGDIVATTGSLHRSGQGRAVDQLHRVGRRPDHADASVAARCLGREADRRHAVQEGRHVHRDVDGDGQRRRRRLELTDLHGVAPRHSRVGRSAHHSSFEQRRRRCDDHARFAISSRTWPTSMSHR